jgi:hypothetical protein
MRTPVKLNLQVREITDNSAGVFKAISVLRENDVLVGVPEENTERKNDEPTNAMLAYINDKGSPTQNIPPRPFLEPGIQDAKDRIEDGLRKAGEAALDGKSDAVLSNLNAVGLVASTSVKLRINTGPFVPLKPATVAARRRQGFTGTRPLIVTAQLRNSVTFIVRKAK